MRWISPILVAALAAFGVFLLAVVTKQPRHDRDWYPHLSRLPHVALQDGVFSIAPYGDWTYTEEDPDEMVWSAVPPHRIGDVRRVWFVMEPHPGLAVMAHTFVMFEFGEGDLVGLTIEARKETRETYSALRGAFNKFELLYYWASPRDLMTRRAVMMDRELYMYPLALSQAEAEAYLTSLLDKTVSIEQHPRFYNTLTSNCTNELAKAADIPWHPAFILTGGADRALHLRGRIAGEGGFDAVHEKARVDACVRRNASWPHAAFNAALVACAE
ncbi:MULTISPECIES: DUF4105 domain-containing protein [Hyphomonas]|uniref:lipoprotein N-acyltransferase Lnb domain-containing protein n=1 Tax=Hyphomonas TaxID=85 RepID=UPI002354E9BB|nr:DUF4105 domain-containing protein [Hyphomonas adhaerens]